MGWSGKRVRQTFLEFFRERGHEIARSYPLVPPNDPTLMFTNAGMVQFKDVFTGKETRAHGRAASSQKCIRISGKHNDLENVGRTSRHHTFFEMLGNFSFGDYFKKDACRFAWELITEGYGLPAGKLVCSVHESDDEAFEVWRDEIGLDPSRIFRLGDKDNFWSMGETGPCGPCSEILYDRGDAFGAAEPGNGERFFELWNLVFMQYQVDEPGGARRSLPAPSIDTGAGLERIASVLQGVSSNYDTDLLRPLVDLASEIAGKAYGAESEDDVSMRVIADHARMTAFCIAEGIVPEKKERSYVLRRVMRRAIRHGYRLGIEQPFLHRVALRVVDMMGEDYPELVERRELVERTTLQEERLFRLTLGRGLGLLRESTSWIQRDGERLLPGAVAYDLYQQDGFPKDLIEVIGREEGFGIDEQGWLEAEAKHKTASKGGEGFSTEIDPVYFAIKEEVGPTAFLGYDREVVRTEVAALVRLELDRVAGPDGAEREVVRRRERVERVEQGDEAELIFFVTPCYGEGGGQVGDRAAVRADAGEAAVVDTQRPLDLFVHRGKVTRGTISVGDGVEVEVDREQREAIRRNHSATHLLHSGLRAVLGGQATQRGSVVAPDLLRFDFGHGEALTAEQIRAIEDHANRLVLHNVPVETEVASLEEARARGAMSLFGEKYGETVRMVRISPDSVELCGGTHVGRSGDIGLVKITRQESIGAGVRRIYAVSGTGALAYTRRLETGLDEVGRVVREGDRELVAARVDRLEADRRRLLKEVDELKRKLATGEGRDLLAEARDLDGVKVAAVRVEASDQKTLMDAADSVRDRLGSGVALLGADHEGKASLVLVVTKDLTARLDAVRLIREVAPAVGARGGGGRPDLARTGGPDGAGVERALAGFHDIVARALRGQQGG